MILGFAGRTITDAFSESQFVYVSIAPQTCSYHSKMDYGILAIAAHCADMPICTIPGIPQRSL